MCIRDRSALAQDAGYKSGGRERFQIQIIRAAPQSCRKTGFAGGERLVVEVTRAYQVVASECAPVGDGAAYQQVGLIGRSNIRICLHISVHGKIAQCFPVAEQVVGVDVYKRQDYIIPEYLLPPASSNRL